MILNYFGYIINLTKKATVQSSRKEGKGMIYTVTFNPSLDYIVTIDDFKLGLTNRTSSELLLPGGKGINVSTVLRNLGIESTALGFIAGFTGEEVVRRMEQMGVKNGFIKMDQGFTRINLKLKSMDGMEINGMGPVISEEKIQMLMDRLNTLKQGDVLFLSGSIPASMPDDAYQKIMKLLAVFPERELSLEQMAEELHMSKYHFLRKFRERAGLPPHRFCLQCSIRKAQKRLRAKHSIIELALEMGFYDQSHFDHCFKSIVGISPKAYIAAKKIISGTGADGAGR